MAGLEDQKGSESTTVGNGHRCELCHEVEATFYCIVCRSDTCATCKAEAHTDRVSRLHHFIPLTEKDAFVVGANIPGTAEYQQLEVTERAVLAARLGVPSTMSEPPQAVTESVDDGELEVGSRLRAATLSHKSIEAARKVHHQRTHSPQPARKRAQSRATDLLKAKGDMAERFLSQQSNICKFCQKNPRSLYCVFCRTDACLSCSAKLHQSRDKAWHKRIPMTKKYKWVSNAKKPGTPEYKLIKDLEAKNVSAGAKVLEQKQRLKMDQHPSLHVGSPLASLESELITASPNSRPPLLFISYAKQDKPFVIRLHSALSRSEVRVWVDWENVPDTGDWIRHIVRAVEQCGAFIFVISPLSIASEVCQFELKEAAKHGKRIVPVVYKDVDYTTVSPAIAQLSWIFFTNGQVDDGVRTQEDQEQKAFEESTRLLLKAVTRDAEHARIHTWLLRRSLEWQKSGCDPGLLLYGQPRQEGQRWLHKCATGHEPRPNKLMLEYITTSLGIAMDLATTEPAPELQPGPASVFLCYARGSDADREFAHMLYDVLERGNRPIWVIWKNFTPTPEWMELTKRNIEESDVFLYVMSPQALADEPCHWQLDHAAECGKRIIPIVFKEVEYHLLRGELASLSWIFMRQDQDDFKAASRLLVDALATGVEHAKMHTLLLTKAKSWLRKKKNKKKLLKPTELRYAQDWLLDCAIGKEPRPSFLMLEHFTASQKYAACTVL